MAASELRPDTGTALIDYARAAFDRAVVAIMGVATVLTLMAAIIIRRKLQTKTYT